jgi:hypothetical protein
MCRKPCEYVRLEMRLRGIVTEDRNHDVFFTEGMLLVVSNNFHAVLQALNNFPAGSRIPYGTNLKR